MTADAMNAKLGDRRGRPAARAPRHRRATCAASSTAAGSSATSCSRSARRDATTAGCGCRSSAGSSPSRSRACCPWRRSALADDLWSGDERGFRDAPARGRDDRRPQARRHPALRPLADALALRRAARRALRERAQPARHAAGQGAEGVRAGVAAAPGSAARSRGRRRPARALRSSRDGDAGGLGFEHARRRARFTVRGQAHGEAALERDRGARGPHAPR